MILDIVMPEIDATNISKDNVNDLLQKTFIELQNAIGVEKALYAFTSIQLLAKNQPEMFESILSDQNINSVKSLIEKSKTQKIGIMDVFSEFPIMQGAFDSIMPNLKFFK